MGTISLPNLDAIMQMKDPDQRFEALVNTVGILIKNLSELNGYLSSKNIKAQSIQTESLAAGAVTAEKIEVDELSAITANMGKLTSGEIYGAYIATAEDAYPRAEMSSDDNLFRAYQDANNFVAIETTGPGSTPAFNCYNADSATVPRGSNYLTEVTGNTYYTMFGVERIQITGTQIWLNGPILINSYSNITDGGVDLQSHIDILQNQITALESRFDAHGHDYSGTTSDGATYSGTTDGPNN